MKTLANRIRLASRDRYKYQPGLRHRKVSALGGWSVGCGPIGLRVGRFGTDRLLDRTAHDFGITVFHTSGR